MYTPDHVVSFTLDQAGYGPDDPIDGLLLLDPACGAGAFLTAAVRRLAERLRRKGCDIRSASGARALVRAVKANVFGVDVDPRACNASRRALAHVVGEVTGRPPPREDLFASNVVESDFLLGRGLDPPSGATPRTFAFIVGNPPFVATTRLGAAHKSALRRRFVAAHGRIDLYVLFIERSIALLGERGRLAFITPDKLLSAKSVSRLRRLMLQTGAVRTVASFRSHRVFPGAATVPCITVYERNAEPDRIDVLECADRAAPGGRVVVLRRSQIPAVRFTEDCWNTARPDLQSIAQTMRDGHGTLADCASRVSVGLATGLDSAFVLPRAAVGDIEPELLRSAVRGRDVSAYEIEDPGLALLLPYMFGSAGRPELVDIDRYPGARRHLEAHADALERRHCVRVWRKRWFDLHDPVPFDIAATEKIIVPDLAESNRFALDHGSFAPLHSAYYIVPLGVNAEYLTAILNSSAIEFLMRLESPVAKDGFNRYRRQFLLRLPVPASGDATARAIVAAAGVGDHAACDGAAARLLGLSSRQERTIERHLAELRNRARASRTLVG